VEGWSQHTTVTAPLVTGTQQEPVPWEGGHGQWAMAEHTPVLQGCPQPPSPALLTQPGFQEAVEDFVLGCNHS
jgi:hypothetical protein